MPASQLICVNEQMIREKKIPCFFFARNARKGSESGLFRHRYAERKEVGPKIAAEIFHGSDR